LSYIKSNNVKAGIVLNPITPLECAFEAAEYCDFILLMSVNPGFGGQKFINNLLKRANRLRRFLDDNNLNNVEIEVDGGVTLENVKEIQNSGVNIFVSGSGLFSGDFENNVKSMKSILNNK
jgi:ribulose-phosphate 3-epimerase